MPNRFSTQAANADAMNETPNASEGLTNEIGADGTPRDRSDRQSQPDKKGGDAKAGQAKGGETKGGDAKAAESKDDQAKPGKDVNSAGSVKTKDSGS